MAKGRMVNKKISVDDKVNKLPDDTARLLFTWLIPNLDVNGCFYGDASLVKSFIFPRRIDITVEQIANYLDAMNEMSLIIYYSKNGDRYLYAPGFRKNQTNLREDREGDSGIPPYDGVTPELIGSNDGVLQDKLRYKIREDKIKIREDKINIILPDFIDKELWNDFLEMRTKKRVPNTDRAQKLLINRLVEFQNDKQDANKIIEQSIMRGWTGVFSIKDNMGDKYGINQANNQKSRNTHRDNTQSKQPRDYTGGKYGHMVKS